MALVRGKFISADEVIKQNLDPSAPEDLARKLYVDTAVEPLTTATDQNVPNTVVKRDNTGGFNTSQMYFHDQNIPLTNTYGYIDYTELGLYNYDDGRFCILAFNGLNINQPEGSSFVGIGQIQLLDALNQPSIPAGDAYVATKKYVDDQVGATLKVPHKENFVLTNTDISNGYVDLTRLAVDESTVINLGGIEQQEDDDYTVSTVGGVTRLTFVGPLLAAVVPGDKVYIRYWSLS